jgi:hypothetical protein
MARKPNYSFERKERDRLKAEKKARRAAEKQNARDKNAAPDPSEGSTDTNLPEEGDDKEIQ